MMLNERTQCLQTLYCWVDEEIEISNHLPAVFASSLAVEVQGNVLGIIHSLINRTSILNRSHVDSESVAILNRSVQELNGIHDGVPYLNWVRLPSIQILQVILEFLLQVFYIKRRDKASLATIHHEVIEHLFLWSSISVAYLLSQLAVLIVSQHKSEIPRGSEILSEQIVVLCILTNSSRCQRHGQVSEVVGRDEERRKTGIGSSHLSSQPSSSPIQFSALNLSYSVCSGVVHRLSQLRVTIHVDNILLAILHHSHLMFSLLAMSLRISNVQSVSFLSSIASCGHLFHLLLESFNCGLHLIAVHLRSNLRCGRNPLFVSVIIHTLNVPCLAQGEQRGWMILSQEHQVLFHPVLVVQQDSTLGHVLNVGDRVISDRGSAVCRLQGLIERTFAATYIVPYFVGRSAIPATERNIMAIHIPNILISIFVHHSSLISITENLLGGRIRSIPKVLYLGHMLTFNIPYQLMASFLKVWATEESR